jgi:hypothetical protein
MAAKKFCSECGAGLSRAVPLCNAENSPGAKLRSERGAALSEPIKPAVFATSLTQLARERRKASDSSVLVS